MEQDGKRIHCTYLNIRSGLVGLTAVFQQLMNRIGKIEGVTFSNTNLVLEILKDECSPKLTHE